MCLQKKTCTSALLNLNTEQIPNIWDKLQCTSLHKTLTAMPHLIPDQYHT